MHLSCEFVINFYGNDFYDQLFVSFSVDNQVCSHIKFMHELHNNS